MRASNIKTTSVGPGTYKRTFALVLTRSDDGETWLGNRTAEIDGGGKATDIFLVMGGSGITIDGFRLKNILYRGVGIHGGAAFSDDPVFNVATDPAVGNIVQNTEVSDISAPSGAAGDYSYWNSGGVVAEGVVPNTMIARNYFHDTNSMGARIGAERPGDDISGSSLDGNVVVNSMQVVSDGGAIYVQDEILNSVNISITHNYIYNFQGPSNNQGRGIYLDQSASNVTVTDNIIRAGPWGAEGAAAVILSGGSNNTVKNNIIDLGCNARTITAVFLMLPRGGANTPMAGNSFERNLVLSNFSGAQNTFFFNQEGYSYYCGGKIPPPKVAHNIYFNAAGGEEGDNGNCLSDAAPVHVNPRVSAVQYQIADGSSLLNAPVNFRPIHAGWGPDSVLPEAVPGACQAGAAGDRPWSPRVLRRWVRRLTPWR
ncbi:right-handed parallel beta-helix repeat-containing protein [Bradyrhizobium sp. dw_78]|uniref:right-handed parallel beta-helix repeat-containing protein n=1 Tax=Bradyrhizobium sp. dw_78 TaxID=2719793 RepID=UPI001BD32248|nr:right-handed parallel beta-helix repeat-containing protein [Bradyrhizobium sp. dw_78]